MELLIITGEEGAERITERVALAKKLGHKEVLLLFTRHDQRNTKTAARLKTRAGLLITSQEEARKHRKEYDAIVAPPARAFFESRAVTHILNPEASPRRDFLHHRNSGLNQVLLKLAKQRGITLLASTSQLLNNRRPEEKLGRMIQNARFARKYGVAYEVVSGATSQWEQRDAHTLAALNRELQKLK